MYCDELPDYHPFQYASLGNFSISTREDKYVKISDAILHNGIAETPPYHFRKEFGDMHTPKSNAPMCLPYPYYSIPGRYPYSYYLDIRKAYLQIAARYGGEVRAIPGKSIAYGYSCFSSDLFRVSRVARGLLVTGTNEKIRSTIWEKGDYSLLERKNSLYSPHLRAVIMNTLHAIAYVLKPYVVYWHTDGLIVPSFFLSRVERILQSFDFQYAIKGEGETIIHGVGSYVIGSLSTLAIKHSQTRKDGIIEYDHLWYLSRFAKSPNPPITL